MPRSREGEADYYVGGAKAGCTALAIALGHPVSCLTCGESICWEELSREEIAQRIAELKAHRLQAVGPNK